MRVLTIAVVLLLAGCGSDSNKNSSSNSDDANLTGIFVDSAVEGIGYRTETKNGFTNNKGEFNYREGETVTFFIGDLDLPPVATKAVLTPLDIANTNEIGNEAINISILLQSLDADADPSNGIRIAYGDLKTIVEDLNFEQPVDNFRAAIGNLASNAGNSVVTQAQAVEHLQGTLTTLGIAFSSEGISSSVTNVSSKSVSSSSKSIAIMSSTAITSSSEKSVIPGTNSVSSIGNSIVTLSSAFSSKANFSVASSKATSVSTSKSSIAMSSKATSSLVSSVISSSSKQPSSSSRSSSINSSASTSKSSAAVSSKAASSLVSSTKSISTSSASSSSSKQTSSSSRSSSSNSSSNSPATSHKYTVNNSSELTIALGKVTGGESILLNKGNYGDLTISKEWNNYITLQAADKHQAIFNKISLDGENKGYITFDGISAHSFDVINNAHHVKILNTLVRRIIYFKYANNIEVRNTEVRTYLSATDKLESTHSVLANHVKVALFEHNIFTGATQDLMRVVGDSDQITIRRNMFYNSMPNDRPDLIEEGPCEYDHTDALQGFGVDSFNPRNMIIEGNFFYDDPSDNEIRRLECTGGTPKRLHMQGVFLSDPKGAGYVNVQVRNNYFYLGSPNTIYINSATDVIVENNTLLGWNEGGGGSIRVVDKAGFSNAGLILRNNIARAISDESDTWAPVVDANTTYKTADLALYFQLLGEPNQWKYFLPVLGSSAEFHGAFQELQDIEAGEAPPPGPAD